MTAREGQGAGLLARWGGALADGCERWFPDFVPSGGGKWVIEAPYLLAAAQSHGTPAGWVVQIYNAAEALPNLVNPFWMLPLMGILGVKARELAGFSILQLLIHTPLVILLCWLLTYSF